MLLSAVAKRLEGGERENVLREALQAARQISDVLRPHALIAVAERLDTAGLQHISPDFLSLIGENGTLDFLHLCASQWEGYAAAGKKTSDEQFAFWLEPLSRERRSHLLKAIGALLPIIEHLGGRPALIETANAISDTARWWR